MPKNRPGAIDVEIGAYLRILRQQAKASQAAISTLLRVKQQQISKYELGKTRISREALAQLAAFHGKTLGQLETELRLAKPEQGSFGESEAPLYVAEPSKLEPATAGVMAAPVVLDLSSLVDPADRKSILDHYTTLMRRQERLRPSSSADE